MDLSIILRDWPYDEEQEANNIRMVPGIDGTLKVQIRLKHGVIQWDADGRPDGTRPYGCDSVLFYCLNLVEKHDRVSPRESGRGFRLDRGLVTELADEMEQFEERGAAFSTMGDFARARRDIRHNLRILEIIRNYYRDPEITTELEHHRPRLLMSEARCAASLHMQRDEAHEAVVALNQGIREIEGVLVERGTESDISESQERQALIDLRRSIRERYDVPLTDEELLDTLKAEQEVAIEEENYELAARLRDKINTVLARLSKEGGVYH